MPLQSCCCPVQKYLPRMAALAWQLSRYLCRASVNFKINSRPLFTIIFKHKNDNFKTRDFIPLIESVLVGVLNALLFLIYFWAGDTSILILHQSLPSEKCEGRSLTSNQKVDLISYIITNLTLYCILVSLKTVVTFFLIYLLPFQNIWTLCTSPIESKTFKNNSSIRVHYAMQKGSAQKSCAEKTFNLYFFQYIIS